MIALWIALLSAVWLSPAAAQNYTVHSSFVFANTGDRTPILDRSQNPMLTNLGAQQMYNLGQFFRRRYIASGETDPNAESTMLNGLSSWRLNNDEIFVQTVDAQYTTGSATAFMQGFYPPFSLGLRNASSLADPSSMTSNGTYLEAPLNGYQYPIVDTVSKFDPYSVYLSGTMNCDAFANSAEDYYYGQAFNITESSSRTLYQSIGHVALNDVLPQDLWSYTNAYLIYDYINYQYTHNTTAYNVLSGPGFQQSVERLHSLASQKQWDIYGDQGVSGLFNGDKIRTVGGQTLAARINGLISDNIGTRGARTKFTLAVGEYDVMMSLFSLLNLPYMNPHFELMPTYGSAFAFELYSYENDSSRDTYPSTDDLYVRFLYANGTADNSDIDIQAYPIFQRTPSQDIRWSEFRNLMAGVGMENIGDWCNVCNSNSLFCPAFTNGGGFTGGSGSFGNNNRRSGVSPEVAGVIGAIVTLAVMGLAVAAAMFLLGVRFHRNNKSKKHDLGGFKGSAKLASDADLHIPKNAAPIGVSAVPVGGAVASKPAGAHHERVGSWEMGDKKEGRDTFSSFGGASTVKEGDFGSPPRKNSFDDDINPFSNPVSARESV